MEPCRAEGRPCGTWQAMWKTSVHTKNEMFLIHYHLSPTSPLDLPSAIAHASGCQCTSLGQLVASSLLHVADLQVADDGASIYRRLATSPSAASSASGRVPNQMAPNTHSSCRRQRQSSLALLPPRASPPTFPLRLDLSQLVARSRSRPTSRRTKHAREALQRHRPRNEAAQANSKRTRKPCRRVSRPALPTTPPSQHLSSEGRRSDMQKRYTTYSVLPCLF